MRTSLKLLVVEDSVSDSLLLQTHLRQVEEISFAVEGAGTLAEGLAMALETEYDAVFLDLGLPDSFGLDTLKKARLALPRTPIIVLTSTLDRNILIDSLNQGADNYLIKDATDGNRMAVAVLSAIRTRGEKPGETTTQIDLEDFTPPV